MLILQAKERIIEDIFLDKWELIDDVAKEWLTNRSQNFLELLYDTYIQKYHDEFIKNTHSLTWMRQHLPRHLLNSWCEEHGYDFMTVCRVLDDKELYI